MKRFVFGFFDVPYPGGENTTGEVAGYLEDRYHIVETFYNENKQFIQDSLINSFNAVVKESLKNNTKLPKDPFMNAHGKIKKEFDMFLESGRMAQIFMALSLEDRNEYIKKTGGFMMAGINGQNNRKKKVKSKKSRVAFVDTGLYKTSFKTWID